jgi:hypothetical protein
MNPDLRGFDYALQPVLNRQQWRIDALHAQLGAANRAIAQARDAIDERERLLRERHAALAQSSTRAIDPVLLRHHLHWLAAEREAIGRERQQLQRLGEERHRLLADCRAHEAKLESLQRHRSDSLADHLRTEQRRAASSADRDWLARHRREERA